MNKIYKNYKDIPGSYWNKIEKAAIGRGISFSLSIVDAWDLFVKQNGRCALSGDVLSFLNQQTASLDRMDSSGDYTLSNVQWVYKSLNIMKWHFSCEHFISYCNLVALYDNKNLFYLNLNIPKNKCDFTQWSGFGCLSGYQWGQIKSKCNRKSKIIDFNLDIKEAWDIYVKQNGRCALTGVPIYFDLIGMSGSATASLDRIDSSLGYTLGNVQWLHKDLNKMKMSLNNDEFKKVCLKISKTNQLINYELLKPSQEWFRSFDVSLFIDTYNKSLNTRRKILGHSGTSVYKGVFRSKNHWGVSFSFENRNIIEQCFNTEEEAAHHYDYYSLKYLGTNCYLNFTNYDYSNFSPKPKGFINKKSLSGYRGVQYNKSKWGKRWKVRIKYDGVNYALGSFDDKEIAARNYDYHAIKFYGINNCLLNFPNYNYSKFIPLKNLY